MGRGGKGAGTSIGDSMESIDEIIKRSRSLVKKKKTFSGTAYLEPKNVAEWLEKSLYKRLGLPLAGSELSGEGEYRAYEAWFAEGENIAMIGIYSNSRSGTNIQILGWAPDEVDAVSIASEFADAIKPMIVFVPQKEEKPVLKNRPEKTTDSGVVVPEHEDIEQFIADAEAEEDPTTKKLKELQNKWVVDAKDGVSEAVGQRLHLEAVARASVWTDEIGRQSAQVMGEDGAFLIPVGVELDPSLLHQDATIVLAGMVRVA